MAIFFPWRNGSRARENFPQTTGLLCPTRILRGDWRGSSRPWLVVFRASRRRVWVLGNWLFPQRPVEGLTGDVDFLAQGREAGLGLAYRGHRQTQLHRGHLERSTSLRPRARADSRPALVRSEINSRLNSASVAATSEKCQTVQVSIEIRISEVDFTPLVARC